MTATGLVRTQYWNLSGPNPTPRTGLTSRAESRTDVEGYLLASDAARNAALNGWGVAAGLQASAVAGTTGVTVAQGVAIDLDGHVVVLGDGGVAIVDPLVGPSGVQNIPTVPVTATGVVMDTTGLAGDLLFTITWREVEEATSGLLVLHQAPWLRLVDPATFVEDGLQLVLAAVTLGAGGVVDALEPGSRRLAGATAGRLELSLPGLNPATGLAAGQTVSGQLAPRADGGMEITLRSAAGASRRALSIAGGTGDVQLDAGLRVAAATALAAGLTVSGATEVIGDVSTTGNLTAGGDLAVAGDAAMDADLHVTGDLRAASTALAALTVSGNVSVQGTTEVDGAVQLGSSLSVVGGVTAGQATVDQLGVHGNATIGQGGNGALTVRHINGKHFAGDTPDGLFLNWDNGQDVNVGGGSPADLNVSRNAIISGRVGVKTTTPGFDMHVNGTVCATVFCNPSDARLKAGVADVVDVLDRLADVRAVTFVRTGAEPGAERRYAGVLAQDVVRAFPELVVPMGTDGLMAVDYAGLAGVLVGAVNELRAANAELASRVAGLDRRESDDDHRG